MDQKAEFGARLCAAMLRAGYAVRPIVLEREFNSRYWGRSVTLQAVRRWLRGEAIPSQDKLQVLAEWLNVEPQVLRFGEKTALSVQATRKRWGEAIGYQEREVFEAFLALPSPQRKVLREVILTFAKAYAEPKENK
jgi:hypothetical protein